MRMTGRSTTNMPVCVRMTVGAYRALLRLCPRDLRLGYSEDMAQVFRQVCRDAYASQGAWGVMRLWAPTLGDLIVGATAEYFTVLTFLWKEFWMTNRLRASAITVFCAYIAFVVAGMGYQKMTEDVIQSGIQDAHPALSGSFLLIEIGAVVALLAVLIGGLPVAFAAVRYGFSTRRLSIPALFVVPPLAFAALVGYVHLVGALHLRHPVNSGPSVVEIKYGFGLLALFILGAIASAWAVSAAIARAQLGDGLVRFTRWPAIVTTLAMGVMFVATLVWSVGMMLYAPKLFNGNDGAFATSTQLSLLPIVVVMGVATIVAAVGLARGSTPRGQTAVSVA